MLFAFNSPLHEYAKFYTIIIHYFNINTWNKCLTNVCLLAGRNARRSESPGLPGSITMVVIICGQLVGSALILSTRRYRFDTILTVVGPLLCVCVRIVGRTPSRSCILLSRAYTLSASRVEPLTAVRVCPPVLPSRFRATIGGGSRTTFV